MNLVITNVKFVSILHKIVSNVTETESTHLTVLALMVSSMTEFPQIANHVPTYVKHAQVVDNVLNVLNLMPFLHSVNAQLEPNWYVINIALKLSQLVTVTLAAQNQLASTVTTNVKHVTIAVVASFVLLTESNHQFVSAQ